MMKKENKFHIIVMVFSALLLCFVFVGHCIAAPLGKHYAFGFDVLGGLGCLLFYYRSVMISKEYDGEYEVLGLKFHKKMNSVECVFRLGWTSIIRIDSGFYFCINDWRRK